MSVGMDVAIVGSEVAWYSARLLDPSLSESVVPPWVARLVALKNVVSQRSGRLSLSASPSGTPGESGLSGSDFPVNSASELKRTRSWSRVPLSWGPRKEVFCHCSDIPALSGSGKEV